MASPAIAYPRKAAEGFVDHLNRIVNVTVSDSRLSLIELPHGQDRFLLTRREPGNARPPIELDGSTLGLHVQHIIDVVEDEEALDGLRCQTASYRYRLVQGDDTLIRWEYDREKPQGEYIYPLAHVHIHGSFLGDGSEATELHIPTMRVPVELILWHVICEPRWNVQPRTDQWEAVLGESIEGFHERRTKH